MSKLTNKDLHFPLNNIALKKLKGHILKMKSEQLTAATLATSLMDGGVVTQDLTINELYALYGAAFGAGESVVVDVLVNGATILTAPLTLDSTTTPDTQIPLAVDGTKRTLRPGDRVQVSRTYVAGGAPAAPVNTVVLEPY